MSFYMDKPPVDYPDNEITAKILKEMPATPVPTTVPYIAMVLDEEDAELDRLNDTIERLTKRIEPVLNPNRESVGFDSANIPADFSPVAMRMARQNNTIRDIRMRLVTLIENLDI